MLTGVLIFSGRSTKSSSVALSPVWLLLWLRGDSSLLRLLLLFILLLLHLHQPRIPLTQKIVGSVPSDGPMRRRSSNRTKGENIKENERIK